MRRKRIRRTRDLAGLILGRLTITKLARKGTRGGLSWLCRCACGKERVIAARYLDGPGKGVRSCGCLQTDSARAMGKLAKGRPAKPGSAMRSLLCAYKYGAKTRKLEWSLSEEQFATLTSSPCHYTGRLPIREHLKKYGRPYTYNGIDRKNPAFGYTPENTVPCCWDVNELKKGRNHEEFLLLIREIAEYTDGSNKEAVGK